MATHFDSVHAGSTDFLRAAACTCDKRIARVLGLRAARHLSLSLCHATPARVQFRSPSGTRMRSYKQKCFFRIYLLVRLIPHFLVCEILLHILLTHCRDVHTFVKAQVFISGNFVFQMLGLCFRFVVFPRPVNLCCVRGCCAMNSRGNRKVQLDLARITAHCNPRPPHLCPWP